MASLSAASVISSMRCLAISPVSATGSRLLFAPITHSSTMFSPNSGLAKSGVFATACCLSRGLHTTTSSLKSYKSSMKTPGEAMDQPKKWNAYNKVLLPPQQPVETRRPAQVFHQRTQIRGSTLRMWYAASAIRGMSIDDALDYCTFSTKKGTEQSW